MRLVFIISFVIVVLGQKQQKERNRNESSCGLPTWTDNLPEQKKDQVYSIWERYEDGDECEVERTETRKVLASLSAELRRRIMASRGPAFLKGASPDVRRQFEELWKNKTIPRTEKPEHFKELAEKLLNRIQMNEFKKFLAVMEKRRKDFVMKLAALSPEARAAHEKLNELRQQKLKIYSEMSESAKDELSKLYLDERIDRHTANGQ